MRREFPNRRASSVNLGAIAVDAMRKYGFRPEFGNAVMQEAAALSEARAEQALPRR